MPNKLTVAFLIGALALGGLPAVALDLPDYGSKNFSPAGDTPAYFTNEAAPVAARTADTTPKDWSAVDATVPAGSPEVSSTPSRSHAGRHGKHLSAQRSGKHSLDRPRGGNQVTRSAESGGSRSAAASRTPPWEAGSRSMARGAPVSAAKSPTVKHGKAVARHAGAAAKYPAAMLENAIAPKKS